MTAIIPIASATYDGTVRLSTPPENPNDPVACGDNDGRLTDPRTPTAHAASHGSDGDDAITIGQSQVTGLIDALATKAALVSPAFSGAPTAPQLHAADGSGADNAGTPLALGPGRSTGSQTPAALTLQGTVTVSSGATLQSLVDIVTVQGSSPNVTVQATASDAVGLLVKGAAVTPTAALQEWKNSDGTYSAKLAVRELGGNIHARLYLKSDGTGVSAFNDSSVVIHRSGTQAAAFTTNSMQAWSNFSVKWGNKIPDSSLLVSVTADLGISRAAAGVLEVNSGTPGTLRDLKCRAIEIVDGNCVLSPATGTQWGTAAAQKQAWWGAAPVVQQVLATGVGATVDDVISLLQTLGLCKQS